MNHLEFGLVEVSSHFSDKCQAKYLIMALEFNGHCRVLDELNNWKRKHLEDYKKIRKVAGIVGSYRPVPNRNHVKEDKTGSGVHEMRAHKGHARLFYMYGPPPPGGITNKDGVVILLYTYWKAKESPAEQDRAFEKGRQMKKNVEQNLRVIYDACWKQPDDK